MSAGQKPERPAVPQPVFSISPEVLAWIVAGNRAVLGLPPQEPAAPIPGRAAYEAFKAWREKRDPMMIVADWTHPMVEAAREGWEAAAQAAIDAATEGTIRACGYTLADVGRFLEAEAAAPAQPAPCAYCEDDPDHPDPDNAATCTCQSPGCGRGWCPKRDDYPKAQPASELAAEPAAPDVRPRADGRRGLDITCGKCGEDYGTNVPDLDEIECVECEAHRCPKCATWFGGSKW